MEANNIQKLREAVEKANAALSCICKSAWFMDANFGETVEVMEAGSAICQALSTPPRNCDVGTADEQEERFKNFCLSYYEPCNVDGECWRCPLFKSKIRCPIAWGQMPYEKGGAK